MSKLRLILLTVVIFVLFHGMGRCQQKTLWNITYTKPAAGTQESLSFNPYIAPTSEYKFTGQLVVTLDVDSSTKQGDNDSLYFFPMYKINDEWFTGDTIQWDRIPDEIDDTILNSNIEAVVVQTFQDSLLIWVTDPTSTTTIEGYPVWLDFKLKMSYNDSCLFYINAELGRQ